MRMNNEKHEREAFEAWARNGLAESVTLPKQKWDSVLFIMDELVDAMNGLINLNGKAARKVHDIARYIDNLNSMAVKEG